MPEVKPAANAATAAKTEATTGTTAGDATAATGDAAKKTRAPKTNLLDIARGRLPLLFVHAIRFTEPADVTNAALAKKYGTSVGKVFDIRKGRNFEYVTKDYKFSAEDLNSARAWAHEAGKHGGDTDALVKAVDGSTVGTTEELAAQAAARPKREMPARKPKDPATAGATAGTAPPVAAAAAKTAKPGGNDLLK